MPATTLVVVSLLFAAGLWGVFAVKFGSGDIFPAYSTFSPEPLGARAVYDAFARVGKPKVERQMLPLARLEERDGTTLVLAGAGSGFFGANPLEVVETFESLLRDGVHLVVTLDPRAIPSWAWTRDASANPWKDGLGPLTGPSSPRGRRSLGEQTEEVLVSAGERWNFQFEPAIHPDRAPKEGWRVDLPSAETVEAPRWFSVWRWTAMDEDWQTVASIEGKPVIIRRDFGRGSITLASDSTFLTNEALWRVPRPGFLLWLLANEPRLVFDETFHGSVSAPGVMHLVRRYRLLGFFLGAAVVVALFAWRAGTSLVPAHVSVAETAAGPLVGAEGASGFSNLLRRSVPPKKLLRTCFTEWAKSPHVRRRLDQATVARVRDLIEAAERDRHMQPTDAYRTIVGELESAHRGIRS